MLKIYTQLFEKLNKTIIYAVWKACHELSTAVDGVGDIDLLTLPEHRNQFQEIVREYGFINASFKLLQYPFIEHWYGFDAESGKICHLHVYYKIITGASHSKPYSIPIEHEILEKRVLNAFGLYEASCSDQALVYSLRHYMKRSSLPGLFLWNYEKRDYFEEYNYIKALLDSGEEKSVFHDEKLYSEFDFHSLDMVVSFRGYWDAKRKVSKLSRFRRFSVLTEVWKSFYYFSVRIWMRLFRLRKRLDKGMVLAVSGVDGSGKTTMVEELRSWFANCFEVKAVHLGKPPASLLTFPLRPLLSIFRRLKSRHSGCLHNTEDDAGEILKKRNGLIWSLRYVVLAYERYRLAHKAYRLANKGYIVISDRYPSLSQGKMDSPRIGAGGSTLVEMMLKRELLFYTRIPKADKLIFLKVSVDTAIQRNRCRSKKDKETDAGIVSRHQENQNLEYCANQLCFLDADCDYDSVLLNIKSIAWKSLL